MQQPLRQLGEGEWSERRGAGEGRGEEGVILVSCNPNTHSGMVIYYTSVFLNERQGLRSVAIILSR